MNNDEILIPDEILEGNAEILAGEDEAKVPGEAEAAQEEENIPKEKTVPLSALHKEREEKRKYRDEAKRLRTVTDRLLSSTGATNPEELLSRMDSLELSRRMRERGVDEQTAREFLKMEEENRKLKSDAAAKDYDRDVQSLAENPLYSDILDVRDEVEEYARDKGLSVKEAYNALFAEGRAARIQEEARRAALAQKEMKQSKKIAALSSAGGAGSGAGDKSTYGLSAKELEVAAAGGMTPQQYAEYKQMR